MKNTIRCCISCILPCGALDVIRIVHTNGKVEEISGNIKASEIMKLHPKHVLKKPSSSYYSSEEGVCPKIVIVPPDAELQRGKIYFLMPIPPSEKSRSRKKKIRSSSSQLSHGNNGNNNNSSSSSSSSSNNGNSNNISNNNLLVSDDQYLSEILSEQISTQRDRRRGRVGVWRPHLESISEIASHEA